MTRLKQLVDENIKKGVQAKAKKAEEKEAAEREKKQKLQEIQMKNIEIRTINAFRFSRTSASTPTIDLSRRLPWGINQEKLRNYAI